MSSDRQSILITASKYWQQGKPLDAGKLIFDSLPKEYRPQWAANILRSVLLYSRIKSPPIERVLAVANHKSEWAKAHEAFSAVRSATLDVEQSKAGGGHNALLLNHLLLAELVAKVTYNATNPPDEFDDDSGWWIAVAVKDIMNLINDENLSRTIWLVLCSDYTMPYNLT